MPIHTETLALTVARAYAKLLAYKDEYEVARLLTQPGLHEEIGRTFEGGQIAFNMAPPFLPSGKVNGRPRKREFGSWILPMLSVLSKFRWVRGTWLDPFGYTTERRLERALIEEYEALVDRTLSALMPANYERAIVLLGLADEVRGFGPVKEAAAKAYRLHLTNAEKHFSATKPQTGKRLEIVL
jgi:indolepyruvate ferredoxin oxidoreductase